MADLPVWLDNVDHMCCGEGRRVGQTATFPLTLSLTGEVTASDGPDRVEVLADGSVEITGSVVGAIDGDIPGSGGTLIASGGVRFGIWGEAPAPRVRCRGTLWEARHHEPSGATTGLLTHIQWRPATVEETGDGVLMVTGYGPGSGLESTGDAPGPQAPASPADEDDEPDDSWAFQFSVRVGG